MRSIVIVVLASTALLISPACKKAKKKKGKASIFKKGGKGSTNLGAAADVNPDANLGRKLDGYITCVNGLKSSLNRTAGRYFSWAGSDPKKPPSKKSKLVFGLYQLHDHQIDKCHKAIAAAPASPETPKLTEAGKKFLAASKAALPLVAEAHTYYSSRAYKADDFAKGAKMHPELVKALMAATEAGNEMHGHVTRINDELQDRRIKRLESKFGRNLDFLTAYTMTLSKQLVRMASVKKISDIELEPFEKAMMKLANAIKEMNAYVASHKAEASRWTGLSTYRSMMQSYGKQVLRLHTRRKTKNMKWEASEQVLMKSSPQMIEGHPAAVVAAYNRMVDASNRMRVRR